MEHPRPTAAPLTADTSGLPKLMTPWKTVRASAIWNARASGSSMRRPNITMSPPTENAFPTPVVTTARTSSSCSSARQMPAEGMGQFLVDGVEGVKVCRC